MDFQIKRPKKGMLGLFHKPVKIGEMNDARQIGLEKFDTVLCDKVMRHEVNLQNPGRCFNKSRSRSVFNSPVKETDLY